MKWLAGLPVVQYEIEIRSKYRQQSVTSSLSYDVFLRLPGQWSCKLHQQCSKAIMQTKWKLKNWQIIEILCKKNLKARVRGV